ncbi:MAG: GNAT family N-acetyltransferase [Gaiellaceae bacterium]
MNVSLRQVEDGDLDAIFQQVTDPESVRMAAFTAEDQTDRRAFLDRMSRLRADTSVSHRVIDVDGAIVGTIASFRIDNQREVTYWVDRTQWGRGIASAALRILLAETAERPLYARAASDNVGSLRVLEKAGFRRVGVNRDFAPGRGEEIEERILRLDFRDTGAAERLTSMTVAIPDPGEHASG